MRERRYVDAVRILTGHTKDDLLETLLMRILRGAGPAGLAAIGNRGAIVRPILGLTRQDVLNYLEDKKIPYRTDSTNNDIQFLRNRVRHKLIPLLDDFFPHWRTSLTALAETQSLTAAFLAAEAGKILPWEPSLSPGGENSLRIREKVFFAAPAIIREEAVFAGADLLAARHLRAAQFSPRRRSVRCAAERGSGDLGPVRLERSNAYVKLTGGRKHSVRGFSLLIKEAGLYTLKARLLGTGKNLVIHAGSAEESAGSMNAEGIHAVGIYAEFPLVFRNCEKGDCLFFKGRKRRFSDTLDDSARLDYVCIVTVCDTSGPAAFIAAALDKPFLVISRDNLKTETGEKYFFRVSLET
jgi:tRNA(Ile)-lysidine synthase